MALYQAPVTRFVARFIGSPRMNLLPARATNDSSGAQLRLSTGAALPCSLAPGASVDAQDVELGVRPEHLRLVPVDQGLMPVTVAFLEQLGNESFAHLDPGAAATELLVARVPADTALARGQRVGLAFPREALHVFDAQGLRLRVFDAPTAPPGDGAPPEPEAQP